LVWPDDSVPQDLRHQARKDALGARDQRDVDLLRPYLLQASGETRVWFVTRKLHKPDRKDPLGVALALEVLSVLEVETELTLPDALLPILEWDDQAVSLRTAELLVRRSTPCSAAVRLLAQRLDASVGTQDPATVLRALAARHDSQPTVDLEEVSEQSRPAGSMWRAAI
jgi:hypothetical protein